MRIVCWRARGARGRYVLTVESGQRVFVGSASASAHIAEALHVLRSEKGAQVTLWSDAFTLSGVSRDTLVAAAQAHDTSRDVERE